ncbi:hypothetical protein [Nannocystis punicea]|uniref:Uncharacterized protein n=1 Tax=Nannocystis punicea TaxID=2995304 RepID=A0ABY7H8I3_9BACT|nr:hypothetical protein [Nannocystis poenicansa]WAS95579.1 hypothetical protein O0S08_05405 [Nannocystis poenicansa]
MAIREYLDGPARDNLDKQQSFVVTDSVGGNYVWGYRKSDNVHDWVLPDPLDESCLRD